MNIIKATAGDIGDLMQMAVPFFYESDNKDLTLRADIYEYKLLELIEDPQFAVFMAIDGDVPAGYVIIYATQEYTEEWIGETYHFYVAPDYRGTGLSRLLVEVVDIQFKKWGCARSYAEASSGVENVNLFTNLWRKFGYKTTGVILTKEF